MAVTALHTASTGLNALAYEIDVIANNLANVNTVGFKASRVNFEDLFYQDKAEPGIQNASGDERPIGTQLGLGVRVSNTDRLHTQGSAINTGNDLDLMIEGDGFFAVDIVDGTFGEVGYTRAGNFVKNSEGQLVLGNSDGPALLPNIAIDAEIVKITVAADGTVTGLNSDGTQTELGQIELVNFINPKGMKSIGGNIFVETEASGPPINGTPSTEGFGRILQGHLENSNVDPVRELVNLIKTQRAFEINSQTIQAADQVMQIVASLRRF